jgi:hypothetical protein
MTGAERLTCALEAYSGAEEVAKLLRSERVKECDQGGASGTSNGTGSGGESDNNYLDGSGSCRTSYSCVEVLPPGLLPEDYQVTHLLNIAPNLDEVVTRAHLTRLRIKSHQGIIVCMV